MSLFSPLSETNPEQWALRFLSHILVGLVAWHSLIWTIPAVHAAWVVPLVYFVAWEALVQRLGAGLWDAALDAVAVALGALIGLELLLGPDLWAFGGLMAVGAAVMANGILRRR